MVGVVRDSWALFLGLLLLMVGNALQGSLLGLRSVIEGFPTEIYGYVSAAYFAGFLGGSWLTPKMLRRVGHVRVFAALASLISAAFIIYAAMVDPWIWLAMRFVVGFCYSGVYIVVESWINDSATNENRGKALSAYMLTLNIGIVAGQQLLNFGDPAGYDLFVLISVLVSISFAPILLSVSPAPVYQTAKPMTLRELFHTSPLGSVGAFLLGGVYAGMFGMSALYGARIGLSVPELTAFLTALYAGAVVFQIPIGWLSDRIDRRLMIIFCAISSAAAGLFANAFGELQLFQLGSTRFLVIHFAALFFGGLASPIYALIIAHTNDFVEQEQMASASGGLVFLNGVGAMGGPILVGYLMTVVGDNGFWLFMVTLLLLIGAYGLYRATQRPTASVEEASPYTPIAPRMTSVAVEIIQEAAYEEAQATEDEAAMQDAKAVLDFWIEEVGPKGWYVADPEVDATIRERFGAQVAQARDGALDHWAETREGALALLILLDQFSRNIHRGSAAAYAGDAKARHIAELAVSRDYDLETEGPERQFFYMPWMHSEELDDQDRCVRLFQERMPDSQDNLKHAEAHRDLIRRFGRFPHRNADLDRDSTAEEERFLAEGGYAPGARPKKTASPQE